VSVRHTTAMAFLVPGGLLLLGTAVLLNTSIVPLTTTAVHFGYVAAFATGLLLAWRFHSTRVFFILLTLVLAEQALAFFSGPNPLSSIVGHNAFAAVSLLIPFNFLAFSLAQERGFTAPSVASRLLLILLESVFVAVISRPGQVGVLHLLAPAWLSRHSLLWLRIPVPALALALAGFLIFALRYLRYKKPVEAGSFWSLMAAVLALHNDGVGRVPSAYLASGAVILLVAVVETSYQMAYHDELTTLPARRAFNEVIAGLETQYAIAIVDVDHFKRFNDTYGHETGDDVLRMVARHLAGVGGGGKPFRCGGEEFSIVFPGKCAEEALESLEDLRQTIEQSSFTVRNSLDRRSQPRGSDRRKRPPRKGGKYSSSGSEQVSVTVSIGVAESSTRNRDVDQVIRAADRALYCAKESGRNRVEVDDRKRAASSGGP